MAEIAAGTIGAIGSVAAAIQTSVAGFSARHDYNCDSQVSETERLAKEVDRAYQEGSLDEEDYEALQNMKKEAMAFGNEYFEAIDEFKKTNAINLPKKMARKKEVRSRKQKLRDANRSLRNYFYDSASSADSDVSSTIAASGSPPNSRLKEGDIEGWENTVAQQSELPVSPLEGDKIGRWSQEVEHRTEPSSGCEESDADTNPDSTCNCKSQSGKLHDYIYIQVALERRTYMLPGVPQCCSYSYLRQRLAALDVNNLSHHKLISLDYLRDIQRSPVYGILPGGVVNSDHEWKIVTELKHRATKRKLDVRLVSGSEWFFVRIIYSDSPAARAVFPYRRLESEQGVRWILISCLESSGDLVPSDLHSKEMWVQPRMDHVPQPRLERVEGDKDWFRMTTDFDCLIMRLYLGGQTVESRAQVSATGTLEISVFARAKLVNRLLVRRDTTFKEFRGLVIKACQGITSAEQSSWELHLRAPREIYQGLRVPLSTGLWRELVEDYEDGGRNCLGVEVVRV